MVHRHIETQTQSDRGTAVHRYIVTHVHWQTITYVLKYTSAFVPGNIYKRVHWNIVHMYSNKQVHRYMYTGT